MSEIKNETATGVVISEEVIEKVASVNALEVNGVAGICINKDIQGLIANKSAKPIRVKLGDGVAEIDINIKIKMGARIDEVCQEVQKNVKVGVQNITNYAVSRVNVHVVDIDIPEKETE